MEFTNILIEKRSALDLALLREAVHFSHICGTADKNEGTQAFLDRRAPAWKGK